MSKKIELLNHYFDYLYGNLKEYFPMVADEIDLSAAKALYISDSISITKSKELINRLIKSVLCDYINTKHELLSTSDEYRNQRYDLFLEDYDLAKHILLENSFICQYEERDYPTLSDSITIDDCKDIVFDFYEYLYGDDPVLNRIKKAIYSYIKLHYSYIRSVAEGDSINLYFENNLHFLLNMVHEVSHIIWTHEGNLYEQYDIKASEIPSLFIEKLFLDYLYNSKIKIIKDKKGDRCLKKKDIKTYYTNYYFELYNIANKIYSEIEFKKSLNKDGIFDLDSYEKISVSLPNMSMFRRFYKINSMLDSYLPFDYQKYDSESYKKLYDELAEKEEPMEINHIRTFEYDIRYLSSTVLSYFFDKIKRNPTVIDNYKEYLKNGIIYSFSDILRLFNIEEADLKTIYSYFDIKYKEFIERDGFRSLKNPYISNKGVKESFKELRDNSMESSSFGILYNVLVKMSYIIDKPYIDKDLYIFDISLQLDDNEVEEYEKLKNKMLQLTENRY